MAEKRTTYKIQDIEGIGEVQIADEKKSAFWIFTTLLHSLWKDIQ